jgi:uncharacterized membrane protein YfcA
VTATQLIVIVLASAAGALVKGVTGMGYPVLAVPLIALVTGMEDAVVIVALPNLAANVYLCWDAREHRHGARDLGRLVGFGALGAVVGTVALVRLPELPLRIALALTIGYFVVQFVRHPELKVGEATAHRWSPAAGGVIGVMQGAVGVSGPVVATWLHGYRLPRETYVYSITLIFGVTGAVQVLTLGGQGQFDVDRLVAAAAAAVPVALAIPMGVRLRQRLAGPAFERAVLAVLVFSAISLVAEVLW